MSRNLSPGVVDAYENIEVIANKIAQGMQQGRNSRTALMGHYGRGRPV